ncbi:MAG: ABC transporter permease [Actinomycetota bacterium]|nr:ABC transporter permease [Actinomycetota bacterium]
MTALVRAELLKLRTVRLPLWLLLTTLLLVVLGVLATVLTAGLEGAPLERDDPDLLARSVASASSGNIVILILGILTLTQEFRFGTATPSFLVTPKRGRVLVAKLFAISVAGVGFALVSAVLAVGASAALIALRDGVLSWDMNVLEELAGVVLVMVLYGPIGIAVGALVRNQIAAVVGALAWTFIAEQLLVALLPDVGRWTPGGASSAVLQLGELATTRGELLPVWGGAALLVAYALVLSLLATRLTLRRDLT